ncbi:MAG: Amuc_1100 family pilus-like protein [Opitutales bacterium]|nr:Amuc_1100 family pilus-like protein [Opitutales bacterium]
MRKIFFKRHKLFFITFCLLLLCEMILLHRYLKVYRESSILSAEIDESSRVLMERTKDLPLQHLTIEQKTNSLIRRYRQFISDTWLNITKRDHEDDGLVSPNNNIALFFEISDFITRNRELCDSLGIAYDQEYAFGFKEYLNKKEQPLENEIGLIHSQKEQIGMLLNYLVEARTNYLRIDNIERGIDQNSVAYRSGDTFVISENRLDTDILSANIYRITFESFTPTFRKYLNNLRDAEIPVTIRGIDIQPYQTTHLNKQTKQYIVQGTPTKYTLTLEVLDLPNDLTKRYRRDARYFRRGYMHRRH